MRKPGSYARINDTRSTGGRVGQREYGGGVLRIRFCKLFGPFGKLAHFCVGLSFELISSSRTLSCAPVVPRTACTRHGRLRFYISHWAEFVSFGGRVLHSVAIVARALSDRSGTGRCLRAPRAGFDNALCANPFLRNEKRARAPAPRTFLTIQNQNLVNRARGFEFVFTTRARCFFEV